MSGQSPVPNVSATEPAVADDDTDTYDECVYTYCGDRSRRDLEFAEQFLQHAGMSSQSPPPAPPVVNINGERAQNALRLFSPDLDFLEMDFDPGIGTEAEEQSPPQEFDGVQEKLDVVVVSDLDMQGTSRSGQQVTEATASSPSDPVEKQGLDVVDSVDLNFNLVDRGNCPSPHLTWCSGRRRSLDPVEQREKRKPFVKCSSVDYPVDVIKRPELVVNSAKRVVILDQNGVELGLKGMNCSGVAAITHVLRAFGWSHTSHQVVRSLRTRSRDLAISVPELLSFCSKGKFSQKDLGKAISDVSSGSLVSSFVDLNESNIDGVADWLPDLIRRGQIPVLTMPSENPDRWAHRFINSVDSQGLHLLSPQEVVTSSDLKSMGLSDTETVKSTTVYSLWQRNQSSELSGPAFDLKAIMANEDVRWRELNVLGQICHIIRNGPSSLEYVTLPSEHRLGITFITRKGEVFNPQRN